MDLLYKAHAKNVKYVLSNPDKKVTENNVTAVNKQQINLIIFQCYTYVKPAV